VNFNSATALNLIGGELQTILFRTGRSIGGIIPNVVIEEQHQDDLMITDHPVEQGAAITDHAYKMPAAVTMHCGWSQSGAIFSGLNPFDTPGDIYQSLLDLQESRTPFDLITGKRAYSSMLIKSLAVTTDKDSENALMVTATMRQIIIVETQVTSLAPSDVQANPSSTAAPVNAGVKQPAAVPQSALYKLSGSITSILGP